MNPKYTQRVLVPGQPDRVTFHLHSEKGFTKLHGSYQISLGGGDFVLRRDCFWDARHETISVLPGLPVRRRGIDTEAAELPEQTTMQEEQGYVEEADCEI